MKKLKFTVRSCIIEQATVESQSTCAQIHTFAKWIIDYRFVQLYVVEEAHIIANTQNWYGIFLYTADKKFIAQAETIEEAIAKSHVHALQLYNAVEVEEIRNEDNNIRE